MARHKTLDTQNNFSNIHPPEEEEEEDLDDL